MTLSHPEMKDLTGGSIARLCGVPRVMPGKTQMAVRLRPSGLSAPREMK
jgi:hypothetical protein